MFDKYRPCYINNEIVIRKSWLTLKTPVRRRPCRWFCRTGRSLWTAGSPSVCWAAGWTSDRCSSGVSWSALCSGETENEGYLDHREQQCVWVTRTPVRFFLRLLVLQLFSLILTHRWSCECEATPCVSPGSLSVCCREKPVRRSPGGLTPLDPPGSRARRRWWNHKTGQKKH